MQAVDNELAHDHHRPAQLNVPVELVQIILSYLDEDQLREQLQCLRLINRNFCALVTPILFATLHLSFNTLSVNRLTAVSEDQNLRKLVKHISIHATRWVVAFKYFRKGLEGVKTSSEREPVFLIHLRQAWNDWRSGGAALMGQRTEFTTSASNIILAMRLQIEHAALLVGKGSSNYNSHFENLVLEMLAEATYGPEDVRRMIESMLIFENLNTVSYIEFPDNTHSTYTMRRMGIPQPPVVLGISLEPTLASIIRHRPVSHIRLKGISWATFRSAFPLRRLPPESQIDVFELRSCFSGLCQFEISLYQKVAHLSAHGRDVENFWQNLLFCCSGLKKLAIDFGANQISNTNSLQRYIEKLKNEALLSTYFPHLQEFSIAHLILGESPLLQFLQKHSQTLRVLCLQKWHSLGPSIDRVWYSITRALFMIPYYTNLDRVSLNGGLYVTDGISLHRWVAVAAPAFDVARKLPFQYLEQNNYSLFSNKANSLIFPSSKSYKSLHATGYGEREGTEIRSLSSPLSTSTTHKPSMRKSLEDFMCHRGPCPFPDSMIRILEEDLAIRIREADEFNASHHPRVPKTELDGYISDSVKPLDTSNSLLKLQDCSWRLQKFNKSDMCWEPVFYQAEDNEE